MGIIALGCSSLPLNLENNAKRGHHHLKELFLNNHRGRFLISATGFKLNGSYVLESNINSKVLQLKLILPLGEVRELQLYFGDNIRIEGTLWDDLNRQQSKNQISKIKNTLAKLAFLLNVNSSDKRLGESLRPIAPPVGHDLAVSYSDVLFYFKLQNEVLHQFELTEAKEVGPNHTPLRILLIPSAAQ